MSKTLPTIVGIPPRAKGLAAVFLSAVFILSGCSAPEPQQETAPSERIEDGAFPVTVKHALGETPIEQNPQRIAVIGWSTPDIVVALGRVPVAIGKSSYGADDSGFFPWFREGVGKLGGDLPQALPSLERGEIDFEALLETAPDLILATYSGITPEDYARLTKIAPTVAYPESAWATPLDQNIEIVGKALGVPEQASALQHSLEQNISSIAQEHPELKGVSFAYGTVPADDSTVLLNGPTDNRVQLLEDLGMELDPGVTDLAEAQQGASSFNVSLEEVSELTPELFVTNVENQSEWDQAQKNKVFAKWSPIDKANVVVTDDHAVTMALSSPSPLSIPWGLGAFISPLSDAAKNIK